MTDCFISTLDNTPNRMAWSRQTIEALKQESALRVIVIDAGSPPEQLAWFESKGVQVVSQPKEGSLFRRFLLAEALSKSDPYIFTDNDILPTRPDWLEYGLSVVLDHPQYAYIVGRLENCDFSYDNGHMDRSVRSIMKGGGLGFLRRGARSAAFDIPEVPDPDRMDDHWYCQAIKQSGYSVGMFEHLFVTHLGRSESTR